MDALTKAVRNMSRRKTRINRSIDRQEVVNDQGGKKLEPSKKPRTSRLAVALIATAIISLSVGGILGYTMSNWTLSGQMSDLQNRLSQLENSNSTISGQVSDLQNRLAELENSNSTISGQMNDLQNRLSQLENNASGLQPSQNVTYVNATYFLEENVSLSQLYDHVRNSVVLVQGIIVQYDIFQRPYYSAVQGSGFVSNITGQPVVTTNYHVVNSAVNITVTFTNGNAYTAAVIGSDAYADLAVLSVDAPQDQFKPLEIANSSTLEVGDPVIAVGNPYGLAGSLTSGIVSALGRTITEELSGGYPIANCIQTTAPINPGNSGGPLLNYQGKVVGITTAIVSDSQGIGFAIPSSTILRETQSLITNGSYNQHPWLGASGTDMTFSISQAMNTSTTHGWLIAQVTSGGPADNAGLKGGTTQAQIAGQLVTIGGDIITAIDGTRITNIDDLSTYLEEHTSPGQTINVTIVRNNETLQLSLRLEARP